MSRRRGRRGDHDQTAEGVKSCASILGLARQHGVDVPIIENVVAVVHEGASPARDRPPAALARARRRRPSEPDVSRIGDQPGPRSGSPSSSAAGQQRARASAAARRRACCGRSTATGTTWCRSASPPTAAGCSSPTTPSRWRSAAGQRARGRAATAPAVLVPHQRRPTASLDRARARCGAAHPGRGRRRASRCCTARSARTARIQGLLELADVPYVGSGVLRLGGGDGQAVHEGAAGRRRAAGRPVRGDHRRRVAARPGCRATSRSPPWAGRSSSSRPAPARAWASRKVDGPGALDAAIEAAREHDPKVVVEAAVVGREIECGVLESLDGGPPRDRAARRDRRARRRPRVLRLRGQVPRRGAPAARPARPISPTRWPPRSPDSRVRSFEALGCEGLARVDFFLTDAGDVVVNEVNTMPGFTPVSMFPRMWATAGLDYPALVDRLLQLALHRRTGLR